MEMDARVTSFVPYLFLGLSLVFILVAVRPGSGGIALHARLLIALIFLLVGLGLLYLHR
jgi:hypothetical protein